MRKDRIDEIDWLKGFAILCVVVNHSGALEGSTIYTYVVTRAVPVLLVLFGMNSEFWWAGRDGVPIGAALREWASSRVLRLMIPFWAALTIWWAMVHVFGGDAPRRTTYVIASYLGYVPWVRTYWFVTLIVECIVVFPFLRLLVLRCGLWASIVASALITVFSALSFLEIMGVMKTLLRSSSPNEYSYFWIFLPAYSWHIVAGLWLARLPALRSIHAGAGAGLLYVVLVWWAASLGPSPQALAVKQIADVSLAVALLVVMHCFVYWPVAAASLAWCGAASWGLYLAHILPYEAFHMFGLAPEASTPANRWMFALALLTMAVGLVVVGAKMREMGPKQWLPRRLG